MPDDATFANLLRRSGKPVVLVANKMDVNAARSGVLDAWELGLGDPVEVSAEHGLGMSDLRDAIVEALGEERALAQDPEELVVSTDEIAVGEDIEPDEGSAL